MLVTLLLESYEKLLKKKLLIGSGAYKDQLAAPRVRTKQRIKLGDQLGTQFGGDSEGQLSGGGDSEVSVSVSNRRQRGVSVSDTIRREKRARKRPSRYR